MSSTGHVLGVRARLLERGLELGMLLQKRATVVGQIVEVNELFEAQAASGLAAGVSIRTWSIVGFRAQAWEPASASALQEVHPAWPVARFVVAKPTAEATTRTITVAVVAILGKYLDEAFLPAGKLTNFSANQGGCRPWLLCRWALWCWRRRPRGARRWTLRRRLRAWRTLRGRRWRCLLGAPSSTCRRNTSSMVCAPLWYLKTTGDDRLGTRRSKFPVSMYVGQDFAPASVSKLMSEEARASELVVPGQAGASKPEATEEAQAVRNARLRMTAKGAEKTVAKYSLAPATADPSPGTAGTRGIEPCA